MMCRVRDSPKSVRHFALEDAREDARARAKRFCGGSWTVVSAESARFRDCDRETLRTQTCTYRRIGTLAQPPKGSSRATGWHSASVRAAVVRQDQ